MIDIGSINFTNNEAELKEEDAISFIFELIAFKNPCGFR